jgi:hypothetical protein
MIPDKKKENEREEDDRHEYIPGVQEKSTLGGAYNTGVTSDDPEEKDEIEKKGSLAVLKPRSDSKDEDQKKSESSD